MNQNLDLILEKRHNGAGDVEEFISDLCEDVREFLMYLRQEIDEVQVQIDQRDNKCQSDLGFIGDKIGTLTKVQE